MNLRYPELLFIGIVLTAALVGVRFFVDARTRVYAANLSVFKKSKTLARARRKNQLFSLLKLMLCAVCLLSLSVLMARPYTTKVTPSSSDAADVIIVVDASRSMEPYFKQTADALEDFSRQQQGNNIGLLIVSGAPRLLLPPTPNDDRLASVAADLSTHNSHDFLTKYTEENSGSAIGDSLLLAASSFGNKNPRSKTIVLVSDGANNKGRSIDAATNYLVESNIRVLAVHVMTQSGTLGTVEQTEMQALADQTKGEYFELEQPNDVASAFNKTSQNISTPIDQTIYAEKPLVFGVVAIMSFCGLVLLGKRGSNV